MGRQLLINGLTCRVGRAIFGTINIIREIARVLSDEMEKRVIVVDTSNEIAGDSDIPHSGIGRARRMQVSRTEFQHQVMIEAVENHMPEVIIIDEIGTELEALAALMIAEKGVQLVGTTHGNCLKNLISGIQYVTLSDDEARQRGTQKTILERKGYPVFQIIIEINNQNSWTIHEDVKRSIDLLLRENYSVTQIRKSKINKKTSIKYIKLKTNSNSLFQFPIDSNDNNYRVVNNWDILSKYNNSKYHNLRMNQISIYTYSLSNNLIKEAVAKMGIKIILTKEIKKATLIIGLKKHLKQNLKVRKLAVHRNIPIYTINRRSVYQFTKLIKF